MPPVPDTTPPPPARRRTLLIVIAALSVGALLGVPAAWWFWMRGGAAPEAHHEAVEPATGLVPLEPFVVNLAGGARPTFLRITIQLVVPEEHAAEIEENAVARMRVRSEFLEVLTQQTADQLVTPEGKARLRASLGERASKALGKVKVVDVLFTDFLVQL